MGKLKIVLIICFAVMVVITLLFVPFYPTQSTVTQTKNRNLRYEAKSYNQSSIPIFVNVTNTDTIGGTFTVELRLSEAKPAVGGVEFENRESASTSQYIEARATCKFGSPETWSVLQSNYTFFFTVTPPTMQGKYNITSVEYKSLLSLFYP